VLFERHFSIVFEVFNVFIILDFRFQAGGILGVLLFLFQMVGNLGLHLKRVELDWMDWKDWNAPLDSFRYANTYPAALAILASGKLDNVDKLVTHRFSLAQTAQAFNLLARGKDEAGNMVLKVMIGPNP